ncbi:MAG: type II toxin-antitoxin system Phd/YefM family antitoxin [Candidatus Moranbacteria bacterium]|nr:type II toxin-antitoxin system Phd/YefM family antitoxin [Candidatus Moranbacteria bacterium]
MKTKNIISVTQARKEIFTITQQLQQGGNHYILTERGVPKAVLLSLESFEKLLENDKKQLILADGNRATYGNELAKFPGTLIIRDESRVVYLSEKDREVKTKEESLVKAQLFIKLIEVCKYPINLIELGRYVRIGKGQSRRYIEADAIINDENGNVKMIFEVGFYGDYEKNLDIIVEDLFDLAEALSWVRKPQWLVYFSRKYSNGKVQEKILAVNYLQFNTFTAWKKAGRPGTDKIPNV